MYQWLLRALGAYLDEEPSCRITLAEVPDGFLVRLYRALHRLEPQALHFKRETLKEQLDQLCRMFSGGTPSSERLPARWKQWRS